MRGVGVNPTDKGRPAIGPPQRRTKTTCHPVAEPAYDAKAPATTPEPAAATTDPSHPARLYANECAATRAYRRPASLASTSGQRPRYEADVALERAREAAGCPVGFYD